MKLLKSFLLVTIVLIPFNAFAQLTCKTIIDSESSQKERIYYKDGQEIAEEIIDSAGNRKLVSGKIPDGIIKEKITESDLKSSLPVQAAYIEWQYKDGKREGISKGYYESGELAVEISFRDDKREGILKGYGKNGNLEVVFNYKNGQPEGIAKAYYESGELRGVINFLNGLLEGVSKEYYKSGRLQKEEHYKKGKFEGKSKSYYESGKLLSEENYKDDKLNGKAIYYYENGKPSSGSNFKNGELDGISKDYYDNGKLWSEENYKNGKLNGISRRYYENSKLRSEENYKDAKLDGISKTYKENGEIIFDDIWVNGERYISKFYQNGRIVSEKRYKVPRFEYEYIGYYENGKVRENSFYISGKKEGRSSIYFEDGSLICIDTYKFGERIERETFDPENAGWTYYGESIGGMYFFNSKNLSFPSKNIIRVWEKAIYTEKGKKQNLQEMKNKGLSAKGYENYGHRKSLKEINCSTKMIRPLSFVDYSKDGNALESFDFSNFSEWSNIVPDSIGEALYKEVCK